MQNILNKLHKFTSAQEPRKVEFANLEQLKDAFLKQYKKHLDNRDNVLARVRELASEVGQLEREAMALNNDLDKIVQSRIQVEKMFQDLGIQAPNELNQIGNVGINSYSNNIADTFGLIKDIPNKFK